MFERPREILLSSLAASAVLAGTLLGLSGYIRAYDRPVQNWLPQGSFHSDGQFLPVGWHAAAPRSCLHSERTEGNVPLNFVQLEPSLGELWTEMPLATGWRMLHVSLWVRAHRPASGSLQAHFQQGPNPPPLLWSGLKADGKWHLREAVWVRPAQANKLRLSLTASVAFDVAELTLVPSFVYNDGTHFPTH